MGVKGLLLINLGSPSAPTRAAVKTYLDEFLMDRHVIDLPAPLRWLLVRGVITPFRASKSAEAYQKIWTEKGSPLVQFTKKFAEGVKQQLENSNAEESRERWEVRWAMRYGQPSVGEVLKNWKVEELNVVPLYPQYAESSSRTAIERVQQELRHSKLKPKTRFLRDFFVAPEFLKSQTQQIQNQIDLFRPDHVLLSFHGLPEHHMTKLHPGYCLAQSDCCLQVSENNRHCYRAQSVATAQALKRHLKFPSEKVVFSFQSRLGRRPWIKPYTDHVIEEMARAGARRVLVSCPSFVADCLETLEEIQMRLREQFLAGGGEELQLVPAPNAEDHWIRNFSAMVQRQDLKWEPLA